MNCIKKIFCTNAANWGTLPIRLALGIIFLAHGSQKLFGAFGGPGLENLAKFFDQGGISPGAFWAPLAAGGEFFGGLLVLLGLFTRFGALNLVIVMLVAIVHVHWSAGFFAPKGFEYPFALLGMAVALLISGGGAASADACICGKCKSGEVSSETQSG